MKNFILVNLLFLSSVAGFSQNLINNESNVSLGNVGGNYYSNVLSNGGGNSVVSNPMIVAINLPDNNIQQQQSVQVRSNLPVSRGNTRQINNPVIVEENVTQNINAINLVVNNPQVTITKLPNISNGSVIHTNVKSHKTITRSTTHKKVRNNFYTQTKTKVKHKRKPVFKKVKYHTSRCAAW